MLAEVLRALGDGGLHSTAELARRLGVSETLIGLIADDLVQRGYLARLETDCSATCNGCGLASACAASSPGRAPAPFLAPTAKGRLAIDRITPLRK